MKKNPSSHIPYTARLGAAAALSLCVAGTALAQAYPSHPITLIVPFPPGGVADTVARPVAEYLGRALGQSVVVENRAGAGGAVGIGVAARAKPDGYTLLLSLSSISILPEADKILERKPAYQLDDFIPIARVTADPTVLVVPADAPWKSVAEFVADAKKQPESIAYGSSGIYGTMHVPMEMLAQAGDVKLSHIPYTGAGPAVGALLGGHVRALATGPASAQQQIKAGKLRALGHWGDKPLASLPDVPSLTSLGYPAVFIQWSGLFAPAGTPPEIVTKLDDTMRTLAATPAFQQAINNLGSPLDYLDGKAFAAYWKEDAKSIAVAVQKMGRIE